MFKKMLIPIDTDEITNSAGILPHAARIATGLNIPVVFTSVVNPNDLKIPEEVVDEDRQGESSLPSVMTGMIEPIVTTEGLAEEDASSPPHDDRPSVTQIIDNEEFSVKRELNRLAARLCEDNVEAESIVMVSADVTKSILETASECGCDLIAIATRDRGLLSRMIQGSTMSDLMQSSPIPLLAISPEAGEIVPEQNVEISRILVPLDGTPFSETVLPYVEHMAKMLSLEVILVRVAQTTDVPPLAVGAGMAYTPHDARTTMELNAAIEDSAVEYLNIIAAGLESRGIRVNWEFLRGGASASIAELSEEIPNSMIALASHGKSGIKRWVLGSVAEDLIRGTGSPVLVIPSTSESDDE